MDLSIRYVTRFTYSAPVWDSQNALRACPANSEGQQLLSYGLQVSPQARVFTYDDVWGTRVDDFGIRSSHDELLVEVETAVSTSRAPTPSKASVQALGDPTYRDVGWAFLHRTDHTRYGPDIAQFAKDVAGGVDEVTALVGAISTAVHEELTYSPGATGIGVRVDDVWSTKAGVCQDYAHLTIAMLRSLGVSARYVSGYFYASDPTLESDVDDQEIVVATHAWVEAAIPGWGWWAVDPTNDAPVGERHVKIGHGRDYDDVTPLRGVYYGDANHALAAEVTMSRGDITRRVVPEVVPSDAYRAAQSAQQ